MGLKIIISSAVKLAEKVCVKDKLIEMEKQQFIKIDDIYDCNDRGTFWNVVSKQEEINEYIDNADWFICLMPNYTIGEVTWGELEYVLKRKIEGAPIAISVFHPYKCPRKKKTKGKIPYDVIEQEAQKLLGSKYKQYFVDYKYNVIDDLIDKIKDEYEKAHDKEKVFWSQHLGYYVRRGEDVRADYLFFDKERTKIEWGFKDGPENYIWRNSVDGKIRQKMDQYGNRFLFITGKPTSGKSRALYECLHSILKNENVVVMRVDNVIGICNNLEIEIEHYDKKINLPKRFRDNKYYFVCDQIDDVFKQAHVPEALKLSFLRIIKEYDNCQLLATGTRNSIDSFVEESLDNISPFGDLDFGGNSDIITIPSISKDIDSQEILSKLHNQYYSTGGETIGDFIKELSSQKKKIANKIIRRAQQDANLSDLLKSIQLVLTYRHITPLLLPIFILRKAFSDNDALAFKNNTIKNLNFLIRNNVIKITDTESEEKEIYKFPAKLFCGYDEYDFTIIDDEEYPQILPNYFTFSVNELIWEYLNELSESNGVESILFNLYDVNDLKAAMAVLFDSYPHAATLRRIVSRLPLQFEWQDKSGNERRKQVAWAFAKDRLCKLDVLKECRNEIVRTYNILIGRADTTIQVDELLTLMQQEQIEVDDSTIGELYSFVSQKIDKCSQSFVDFVNKIDLLNKEKNKRYLEKGHACTCNSFYRVSQYVKLFSERYEEAYNHVFNALYHLTYIDDKGNILKEKNAVKNICKQKNTIEKRNLDRMISVLASFCKTTDDVARIAKCHKYFEIEYNAYVLHHIGVVFRNVENEKYLDLVNKFICGVLPDKKTKEEKRELYELMVVCFVIHMPNFVDSSSLYMKWHDDLEMGDNHNMRLVSLCLRNCKKEEFQSAVAFVNRIPNEMISGITWNLLVSVAPNPEEVINLVNRMAQNDIDEYTLSNCLKCIDTVRQMNLKSSRFLPIQIFIMVYEIINHPKLKGLINRPSCLQKIYRLVSPLKNDCYQEEYINQLIGPQKIQSLIYNNYINTTRINNRTFSKAYEDIYSKAVDKIREKRGTIQSDLFCSMCAKYYKEEKDNTILKQPNAMKYVEQLDRDIKNVVDGKRGTRIIQDEYFFLNYHIKHLKEPLFSEDGNKMSLLFMEWFEGKRGNYNPDNLSVLSRYLEYIIGLESFPAEKKWTRAMALYSVYSRYFEDKKKIFMPDEIVFVCLFKIIEKCSEKMMCLSFIDSELIRLNIERTTRINYYIQKNNHFPFKYNEKHPLSRNRQIDNMARIQKAKCTEDVMDVMQEELRIEGIVTPTIINCALSRYREYQREHKIIIYEFLKYAKENNKDPLSLNLKNLVADFSNITKEKNETNKILRGVQMISIQKDDWKQLSRELYNLCKKVDDAQIEELMNFITANNLTNSLSFRGYSLLALLTKNRSKRIYNLEIMDTLSDISESAFGMLASEKIIAQTDIKWSRLYFRKWLKIFIDIYVNNQTIANYLPEEKWKTIEYHLKHEIYYLNKLRKSQESAESDNISVFFNYYHDKEEMLESLDVIATILKLYNCSPQRNNPDCYLKSMSLDDLIQLLILNDGNTLFWEGVHNSLK